MEDEMSCVSAWILGFKKAKWVTTAQKKNIFYLVFIYPQADTKEFEKSQTPFHSNRTDNKNGDVDGDRNNILSLHKKRLQIKSPVNPFLGWRW